MRHPFKTVPGFLYILVLYVAGSFIVPDSRTTWELWGGYQISWDEVLMVAAAMMAIAEQLKVSHPGIDNTTEAILMVDSAENEYEADVYFWANNKFQQEPVDY